MELCSAGSAAGAKRTTALQPSVPPPVCEVPLSESTAPWRAGMPGPAAQQAAMPPVTAAASQYAGCAAITTTAGPGGNSAADCKAGQGTGAGHRLPGHAFNQPAKSSAAEADLAAGLKQLPPVSGPMQPSSRCLEQQPQPACAWNGTHGPAPTNHPLPLAQQPASSEHAALAAAELPACSLHNVKPLVLGQQQLTDLLHLEGALQGGCSAFGMMCLPVRKHITLLVFPARGWGYLMPSTRLPLTHSSALWLHEGPDVFA